ncbi:Glutamate--cysteine ligase, GCS2 [Rhabdaerophilaceae bacterium]
MQGTVLQSYPAIGVELEMVTTDVRSGNSLAVEGYFDALCDARKARGLSPTIKRAGGRAVCVAMPDGSLSTIDNGFNNLESCIGPISGPNALFMLDQRIRAEMRDVQAALAVDGGAILNFAQHPDLTISQSIYRSFRAPKPIYDYWVDGRGWQHWVGIDAKAQNGANIDVHPRHAIRALNMLLAFSPMFIALFANSPFEGGRVSGLKETRLTIWPRMFAAPTFGADRRQHILPEAPFASLNAYFNWMFGGDTAMQIIPMIRTLDYKGAPNVARVEGDPSFLTFLASDGMMARQVGADDRSLLKPDPAHFEFLQFSHFLDARFRWRFATYPSIEELRDALSGNIEALFERRAAGCYIEMRAAGANFPDAPFLNETPDDVGSSMVISVTALAIGLMRNLDAAEELLTEIGWEACRAAREPAIKHGLSGQIGSHSLREVSARIIELSSEGLPEAERWALAYPAHVIRTGQNGADRALTALNAAKGPESEGIRAVAASRIAVDPDFWSPPPRSPIVAAPPNQGALAAPSMVS